MLEKIFTKSNEWFKNSPSLNEYYHVGFTEDKRLIIADDCPPDRFELLRKQDARFFEDEGRHLFANFETEDKEKKP